MTLARWLKNRQPVLVLKILFSVNYRYTVSEKTVEMRRNGTGDNSTGLLMLVCVLYRLCILLLKKVVQLLGNVAECECCRWTGVS